MKQINLPRNWDECYIDQYIGIRQIELNNDLTFYSQQIEKLAILTDTNSNDDIWEDMSIEEISDILKELHWMKIEPSVYFKNKINEMTFIDLYKMSFGEFLDLEYLFTDYYSNLTKICGILYRKTKINEWGDIIFQSYTHVDFEKNAKLFEELYITDVYGIIPEYLKFKEFIITSYDKLFQPIIEDDKENEEAFNEMFDENEKAEILKQEEVTSKWGWELIIRKLTNNDITKIPEILELPLILVLNQISLERDLPFQS